MSSLIAAAGCSNESQNVQPTTDTKVEAPSPSPVASNTIKESPAKQEPAAEEVLKKFYDAYIKKDYDSLPRYINSENLGMSTTDYIKQIKENDFKTSTEVKEYMISNINIYDETHKIAKVLIKGTNTNGNISAENPVGLILMNSEWKVDFSLIVNKTDINTPYTSENKDLTVTSIQKIKRLDGYAFILKLKNNLADKQIGIGWLNEATAQLTTDSETTSSKLSRATIQPNGEGSITIQFQTKKSDAKSLKIDGFQQIDSKNLPVHGQDPFKLEIPLK